jgi:DNA polymerase III epsilon subunit-like protein
MACGVPVADPHHALDDALVTAQLFLVLAARWEAGGHGARVADLLRLPRLA